MPESFDTLACDLARFQASASDGYARLCHARGVEPSALRNADDIPAVPTDAFKVARIATFPSTLTSKVFRTSGTTLGSRGENSLRDVSTYDAASIAFGRRWLARDVAGRLPVVVLGPSPESAPDSSLVHMCEAFVRTFGEPSTSASTYLVGDDAVIDLSAFDERVAFALSRNQPMLILGTSFAFVHFVDAIGKDSFALPRGSRVMQTGGYKGRSREVPANVLRADLARVFGVSVRAIVAEYGMTELASQFYERTLFEEDTPLGVYAEPPWARVVPVDPDTLEAVPAGEVGLAKIIDLMNVDSAVAVLTQDRVRRVGYGPSDRSETGQGSSEGFELLGRAPGAPARGCSIAIDELLGRATASPGA